MNARDGHYINEPRAAVLLTENRVLKNLVRLTCMLRLLAGMPRYHMASSYGLIWQSPGSLRGWLAEMHTSACYEKHRHTGRKLAQLSMLLMCVAAMGTHSVIFSSCVWRVFVCAESHMHTHTQTRACAAHLRTHTCPNMHAKPQNQCGLIG